MPEPTTAPPGTSISERVFAELCEAISGGAYAPGAKLSEPRLAASHGISRGSLREAIRRLEERQLVTRRPNQGVRVIVPSRELIADLFAIRESLEGLAAREAAAHRGASDITMLRSMLEDHAAELDRAGHRIYRQPNSDEDFHVRIAKLSGNAHLFELLCVKYYPLLRFLRLQHGHAPGRAMRALVEHTRVLDAIEDGDADLSELLMRRHVAAARRQMLTYAPFAHE